MLGLSTKISRALRVLLTCVALVVAMPASAPAVRGDLSAAIIRVSSPLEVRREVSRASAEPRYHRLPTASSAAEPAPSKAFPHQLRLAARRAFLINCSWLC